VPGYSLDDIVYNCVGLQSPAQARQAIKIWLEALLGLGVLVVFVALWIAAWWLPFSAITLTLIGVVGRKLAVDFREIRAGHVSQVDGDIWTERRQDSEGGDSIFVHVGDLRLDITKEAYTMLRDGGPYRIYYLPRAKRAVGGQVLPAWRPLSQPRPT